MVHFVEKFVTFSAEGDFKELASLKNHLRYRPKEYWRSDKYQLFKITDGRQGWDGFLYPLRWNFTEKLYTGYRGWLEAAVNFCREHEIQAEIKYLPRPFKDIVQEDVPADIVQADFQLDDAQRRCIASWLRHGIGILHAAVNSGKTALVAGTIALLRQRFPEMRICYITQAERLVNQARRDIGNFLPGIPLTQFGGGKNDTTGEIVICGAAMLWRHHPELAKAGFFKAFGALFCDELHHVASPSLSKLTSWFQCPFRFGCSDTQKLDDPAKAATIRGLFGPIRDRIEDAPLIEAGRSAKPIIYVVDEKKWSGLFDDLKMIPEDGSLAKVLVGNTWKDGNYLGPVYEFDESGKPVMEKSRVLEGGKTDPATGEVTGDWSIVETPKTVTGLHRILLDGAEVEVAAENCLLQRMYDCSIIQFAERNQRILEWVYYFAEQRKKRTLVVCTRTPHVLLLQALIRQKIVAERVQVLFSKHTTKQRDDCFAWFKSTPGVVLVSPLISEGVSINEIEAGVIADAVADHERAKQLLGRFIRKKEVENIAEIVMFCENQHAVFKASSKKLFRRLTQIKGYLFKPQNKPPIKSAN